MLKLMTFETFIPMRLKDRQNDKYMRNLTAMDGKYPKLVKKLANLLGDSEIDKTLKKNFGVGKYEELANTWLIFWKGGRDLEIVYNLDSDCGALGFHVNDMSEGETVYYGVDPYEAYEAILKWTS